MQSDLPAIASGRKQLDRLILELDTAKARLKTAREVPYSAKILDPFPDLCLFLIFDIVLQEEQHGGPHGGAGGGRAERLAEELDDMERRVEQAGSQFHFSIFITTLLIIYLTPIIKC